MKNSKRLLAMMTAGFLAITPMAATGLTVFAAPTSGTSTLSITDSDTTAHTYKAYQIITGEKEGDVLKNLAWGSAIPEANRAALITGLNTLMGLTGSSAISTSASVQTVAEALSKITDADQKVALAKLIAQYVDKTNENIPMTQSGSTYSAGSLADGWYLILDESTPLVSGDTAGVKVRSANILKVIGDTNVNSKHSLPTLQKKIVENNTEKDANTAAIGDTITYRIKTKVPDTTGYNKYFFIVEDTLSAGLTYNESSISVKVYDKDDDSLRATLSKDEDTDYTNYASDHAAYYVKTSGTTSITVVFEDVINTFASYDAGDDIFIEYTATLNENAVIDPNEGNPNTAKLKYSNDPNVTNNGTPATTPDEPKPPEGGNPGDVVGETPWDKVNTYTTAIKIKKVDQDGNPLKGASFTLYGDNLNKVKVATGATFTESASGTYWKLKNGSYTTTDPTGLTDEQKAKYDNLSTKYAKTPATANSSATATTVGITEKYQVTATVDDDGYLTFTGLNAGNYRLSETGVPESYNKAEDISFTINASSIDENSVTWGISNTTDFSSLDSDNMFPTTIINRKGAILPSTGGMGTRMFYIIGGLLVAGSLVLLVTKKRMSSKEN
ncbi:isopeptide-forming domain-containing fimbrial protein [Ruminococcus sp.]|uniref:isopeptide-forming domain-containing fimbrial protein n=1 Tax=Ruminococcus sp. TaxID=41978 RepID=UPI0025CCCEF3|nr:isopeptide-forming domain-containing fimbrial protein [Ruminococcus sp.]MCR4638791.1 isopeptide-forming domain-containing fimbrial protein [Ruminococcus sp.]